MQKSETDIVGNKLRIRSSLHRELVQAAQRNGVSLNSEMARRLQASISAENLSSGSPELGAPSLTQTFAGRLVQGGVDHQLQAKLIVAAEALITMIEQMPVLEREPITTAIAPVKTAITAIDQNVLANLRRSATDA